MRMVKWLLAVVAGFVFNLAAAPFASAQGVVGAPRPWEMGMQRSYSPIKDGIILLHNEVLFIITVITVFVGALLVWVMVRYNARRNPVPSQTSHNTIIEILWTVVPVLILVIIAIPSFKLIYYQDRTPDPDLTIKVTGHQWYWEYSYPDQGNLDIESRYVHDEDLKPGQLRLLDVDNQLVIPVNKKIRILTTSTDVIHSFFIPAFRVKQDVLPGRYTTEWFQATEPGRYRLYCAQYCGTAHSAMTGWVTVLPAADYQRWLAEPGAEPPLAEAGERLFRRDGCASCHRAGGSGPELEGVFGRREPLADGGSAVADETYLRESILNPGKKVLKGWPAHMPSYKGRLDEAQLQQLVSYLKTLRGA
jgi:cytochrome c oxidase subunit II